MDHRLPVDHSIHNSLTKGLKQIEEHLKGDVLTYYGPIHNGMENNILKIVEELAKDADKQDKLYIILTTNGGSAIAVERYVNILRKHYKEVHFIVPDYAYSAGTIFCMSGDSILMDYHSVLGPIDPQVQNKDDNWVPALGYLDKINEMLTKAADDTLTKAEFIILKEFDLAELRGYEQAKALTIDLLKKWLVKYKFKNWKIHNTSKTKKGNPVTIEEKRKRAEEIADKLSDNGIWKSHGRPINIETLEKDLKLKIFDYSDIKETREKIRNYHELFLDYVAKNNYPIFVHTRLYI